MPVFDATTLLLFLVPPEDAQRRLELERSDQG